MNHLLDSDYVIDNLKGVPVVTAFVQTVLP
jgi:hypothetical protein